MSEAKGLVTVKVALVGPKMAGKSRIANHIYGISMPSEAKYDPTVGVRILPLTRDIVGKREKEGNDTFETRCKIELWDCSGDQKYEPCWPAIMKDLHGIIVAFDPTSKAQANDVRIWCEYFCKNANLQNDQCVIFAHGNLTSMYKPLSVRAGARTVMVPIVNVNTLPRQTGKETDDTREGPSSAQVELLRFMSGVYPYAVEIGMSPIVNVIPNKDDSKMAATSDSVQGQAAASSRGQGQSGNFEAKSDGNSSNRDDRGERGRPGTPEEQLGD
jgi:hypothetical protein